LLAKHDDYQSIFQEIEKWDPETYHMRDGLSRLNAIIYHRYSRKNIHHVLSIELKNLYPKPNRILDLGSGRGYDTQRMAQFFSGAKVVGVEYAYNGVEISKRYNGDRLWFLQGDATNLGIDGGCFDIIFSLAVAEHVNDYTAMIEECIRVLKPGGLLLIATHTRDYWSFWFRKRARRLERQGETFKFHGLPESQLVGALINCPDVKIVNKSGTCFLFPQSHLKILQDEGWNFRFLFKIMRLCGWVYKGIGLERRLYYQYVIAKKTGHSDNSVVRKRCFFSKCLQLMLSAFLFPVIEAAVRLSRYKYIRD
jgi:SAM-dependent methyltransferase